MCADQPTNISCLGEGSPYWGPRIPESSGDPGESSGRGRYMFIGGSFGVVKIYPYNKGNGFIFKKYRCKMVELLVDFKT